jgi:predicted negative regulator of RcsB-dependent stress response
MEFIARRWWRRIEIWVIALLLVIGGGFLGFQFSQWSLAKSYLEQVAEIRQAYDEATEQRDARLDELTRKTGTAADKATKAATTATQAADKADEALNRAQTEERP